MIGIYSCSLLTTADLCAQVHAHHARTYRRCVFEKCFASLHFTENVEDLVSSVAVGLTFKDFLIYIYIYITDDELINCRFDLAFYYYLVSYYTNCVQHSSDKIAIYIYIYIKTTRELFGVRHGSENKNKIKLASG